MSNNKKSRTRHGLLWLGGLCLLISLLILGFAFPTLISSPSAISDKSAKNTANYSKIQPITIVAISRGIIVLLLRQAPVG